MAKLQYDVLLNFVGENVANNFIKTLEKLGAKLETVATEVRNIDGELERVTSVRASGLDRYGAGVIKSLQKRSQAFQGNLRLVAAHTRSMKENHAVATALIRKDIEGANQLAAAQEKIAKDRRKNKENFIVGQTLEALKENQKRLSEMHKAHDTLRLARAKKIEKDIKDQIARNQQELEQLYKRADEARKARAVALAESLNDEVKRKKKELDDLYERSDNARKQRAKMLQDAMLQQIKTNQEKMDAVYKAHDEKRKARAKSLADALIEQAKRTAKTMSDMYKAHDTAKDRTDQADYKDDQFKRTKSLFDDKVKSALSSSTASTIAEVRKLEAEAKAAFRKAEAAHYNYISAIIAGNKKAANHWHWMRQSMVSEANQIATAMKKAAREQKQTAKTLHGSQLNILKAIHSIRYGLYGLGALAGGFGLVHAFQNIGSAIRYHVVNPLIDAFKTSIEFNEELIRSQTVFESLGVTNIGKPIHQIEAEKDKNPAAYNQLMKSKAFAASMTEMLRSEASITGMDMSEVMAVAKQALPDWMNKLKGKDKGAQGLLKNQSLFAGDASITKDLIELSAVLKMLDPGNRALKWQATALMETSTGTTGSKGKASGADAFKSMRTRLGIFATPEEMQAITKAANAGDMRKWMDELKKLLARSGVTANKLQDMLRRSMKANWEGIINNLKYIGSLFSGPVYLQMARFFRVLNLYTVDISKYKPFQDMLKNLGERFANFVRQDYIDRFLNFVKYLETNEGSAWLNDFIESLAQIGPTLNAFGDLGIEFFQGFFGAEGSDMVENAKSFKDYLVEMKPYFKMMGEDARRIYEAFIGFAPALRIVSDIIVIISRLTGVVADGWTKIIKTIESVSAWMGENNLAKLLGIKTGASDEEVYNFMHEQRRIRQRGGATGEGGWDAPYKPTVPAPTPSPTPKMPPKYINIFNGDINLKANSPEEFARQMGKYGPQPLEEYNATGMGNH